MLSCRRAAPLMRRLYDNSGLRSLLRRISGRRQAAHLARLAPVDDAHQIAVTVGPHQVGSAAAVAPAGDRGLYRRCLEEGFVLCIERPADRPLAAIAAPGSEPAHIHAEALA